MMMRTRSLSNNKKKIIMVIFIILLVLGGALRLKDIYHDHKKAEPLENFQTK
jgi:hypothetical protein